MIYQKITEWAPSEPPRASQTLIALASIAALPATASSASTTILMFFEVSC